MSDVEQLFNQGIEAFQRGDMDRAATCFGNAFTRDPNFAPAYNGLGLVLMNLGAMPEALERYDQAIRVAPEYASPYINRGIVLRALGKTEEALASLDRAIMLQPDNPNAHSNRASILTEHSQFTAAVAAFDRTLEINPNYRHARGLRLLNKVQTCDWTNLPAELADLAARIDRGEPASPPWPLILLLDRPDSQRKMAEAFIASDMRENPALGPLRKRPRPERIKIGYYSWDFHRHATAHLIAELFERHDRSKFEITAFSWGPQTDDDMQKRLKAGVDHFINVADKAPAEIARLSREREIDIAIDLKGITTGHRLNIFSFRAAPIQVHYLGYPHTTGAPYIDYFIADNTIVPETHRQYYTEKIVAMPNSYQVNDSHRKASDSVFSRADLDLPAEGFVFCALNNNFKIMPPTFDSWMRILTAVPGSVLWLLDDLDIIKSNLRKAAKQRGVDPDRLVFAPRVKSEEHLTRMKSAGLFLDSWPCNAHTTASDALWVGLPVLTFPGNTFTSRVASSLLNAVGMPEMIVSSQAEYEATAIALANDPARLQALKDKLIANRATAPLFDTALFTHNFEAALLKMVDTYYGTA